MKTRSRRLVLLLIIILVILSAGCGNQESPTGDTQGEVSEEQGDSGNELPDARGDEIEIFNTATFKDEFGYWHVHGLLSNQADYPVGGFILEVQQAGNVVGEADSDGAFGVAPGDFQPFNLRLPQTVTSVDDLEVNVLNIRRVRLDPVMLEMTQSRLFTADNGIVTLVGEVENTSGAPAWIYTSRAALFGAGGELVTTGSCQVCPGYLTPGEKAPVQFLIYGHPPSPVPADHQIYLAAEKAPVVDDISIDFLEPVHTYLDPAGSFHILGDLQNNSEKILALELTASFYDTAGEMIGAAAYRLPTLVLAGERTPFEIKTLTALEGAADWSLRVELARTSERKAPVFELTDLETAIEKGEYVWTVAGKTVNDSGQTLRLISVLVGIREIGTGKLVGLSPSLISGDFPPDEQISYSVSVNPDLAFDPEALEAFVILLGE